MQRGDLKKHIRDYRTILTFMTRMAKKGWLEVEKEGNTNYYTPAVARERALKEEIHQFLDQVVGPERRRALRGALVGPGKRLVIAIAGVAGAVAVIDSWDQGLVRKLA